MVPVVLAVRHEVDALTVLAGVALDIAMPTVLQIRRPRTANALTIAQSYGLQQASPDAQTTAACFTTITRCVSVLPFIQTIMKRSQHGHGPFLVSDPIILNLILRRRPPDSGHPRASTLPPILISRAPVLATSRFASNQRDM